MRSEKVESILDSTGIRREADFVVPINGQRVALPYMVVRTKVTIDTSDNGTVGIQKTEWGVALFTSSRSESLEKTFLDALRPVGKVEVIRYPDGATYQTTFKFTTTQTV